MIKKKSSLENEDKLKELKEIVKNVGVCYELLDKSMIDFLKLAQQRSEGNNTSIPLELLSNEEQQKLYTIFVWLAPIIELSDRIYKCDDNRYKIQYIADEISHILNKEKAFRKPFLISPDQKLKHKKNDA